MRYTVKAFGITKEMVGGKEIGLEVTTETVGGLREELIRNYPQLVGLRSLLIAVNNAYTPDETQIFEHDEIALIPPVSGG